MAQDSQEVERLKYELERDKFQWQKSTHRIDSGVLNRHFGVIATAILSLAAVVVSYLQVTISSNNAKAQLAISVSNAKDQLDLEIMKNDRQFYLEIAKFLLANQKDMASQNRDKVIYLRSVVVSAFPKDVAIQIASRMRDSSSAADVKKIWDEGLLALRP